MMKKYILGIFLSVFAMSIVFSQGYAVQAATSDHQEKTTIASNASANSTISNEKATSSQKAEFVQNTLPQTGVEANHSGLYFSIAGVFLLLAFFTSRSKRYNDSDKPKK